MASYRFRVAIGIITHTRSSSCLRVVIFYAKIRVAPPLLYAYTVTRLSLWFVRRRDLHGVYIGRFRVHILMYALIGMVVFLSSVKCSTSLCNAKG